MFLTDFRFVDYEREASFRMGIMRTSYDTVYPFFVLSKHNLERLDFEPITILYGGNGSGKTTALNIIAEALKLKRDTLYNRSPFFEDYISMCSYNLADKITPNSRIITSDDVFDFMLNVRSVNQGIDNKREQLFSEYAEAKYSHFKLNSLEDYEQLKKVCAARSKTESKYVRSRLAKNVREHSNGESGFMYFTQKITENALFLLDEPENSLSPERQLELVTFLHDSARFFNCQLIIATHSPFLLAMPKAKIYDFDEETVDIKRWTELKNVRVYYDFFKSRSNEFET